MILPPQEVVGRAESLGETGRRWLAHLEEMVHNLEKQWDITADKPLSGGSHGLVCLCEGKDGGQYVLKIDVPENPDPTGFLREMAVLEAADGHGYAKLFAYDTKERACLLERLGPPLSRLGLPTEEQLRLICGTLQAAWGIEVNDPGQLADGLETIAWFQAHLTGSWEELGKPCPISVIRRGLACLESRREALHTSPCVPVHGDAHANNTLACPGGGFKFVDPDGLYYEKAHDLGVLMREWIDDYRPDPVGAALRRCRFLHEQTAVPQRAIWDWGYLQTASTGLVLMRIGQREYGRAMLDLAGEWEAHWQNW